MSDFEFLSFYYSYEDDGEIVTIGFADNQNEPVNYLILQSGYYISDQEVALGMDKIHVELNDQSKSGYCDIEKVVFSSKKIEFHFDEESRKKLKISGLLIVDISNIVNNINVNDLKATFSREGIEFQLA